MIIRWKRNGTVATRKESWREDWREKVSTEKFSLRSRCTSAEQLKRSRQKTWFARLALRKKSWQETRFSSIFDILARTTDQIKYQLYAYMSQVALNHTQCTLAIPHSHCVLTSENRTQSNCHEISKWPSLFSLQLSLISNKITARLLCNLGETDCSRYLGDENNCLEKCLPGEKKGSNKAKLAGGLAAFPEVNSRGRGKEREKEGKSNFLWE